MKNAKVNLTGAIGQMDGMVTETGCKGHVTATKVYSNIIYVLTF